MFMEPSLPVKIRVTPAQMVQMFGENLGRAAAKSSKDDVSSLSGVSLTFLFFELKMVAANGQRCSGHSSAFSIASRISLVGPLLGSGLKTL